MMLMDFQMEGGQAVEAEILSEQYNIDHKFEGQSHEARAFELGAPVWTIMFAAYGIFFGALIVATGRDAATLLVLAISIAYTIMYFGTAAVLNSVGAAERKTLGTRSKTGGIDTQTGWMDTTAVNAQILTVPILFAIFAVGIVIIWSLV